MSLIRNLQALREIPQWGARLVEAFQDVQKALANVSVQANAALTAPEQAPPPRINAVHVTASGGVAHIQVTDNNQIYRGINYFADISTDPGFSAPITVHMGASRDIRVPVGTQPLHYRAYSCYPSSPPSEPVYHGGTQPIPVMASGTAPPPVPKGQGSGTGFAGQISGHGPVPWRGTNPPRR